MRRAACFSVVLLYCFCSGIRAEELIQTRSVPVPNQAHPFTPARPGNAEDEAAARAFSIAFQAQVKAQSWLAVASLAPLREAFGAAPALMDPGFQSAWFRWERQRLFDGWQVDEDGRGLWKMEDGVLGRRVQTLGIRQQPNGQWWIILLRTQEGPRTSGWSCSPNCTIRVNVAGKTWNMPARPPLNHAFRASDALGAPLPLSLLSDGPGQEWEFRVPGDEHPARFDLSWWPSLCRQKMGRCPEAAAQSTSP